MQIHSRDVTRSVCRRAFRDSPRRGINTGTLSYSSRNPSWFRVNYVIVIDLFAQFNTATLPRFNDALNIIECTASREGKMLREIAFIISRRLPMIKRTVEKREQWMRKDAITMRNTINFNSIINFYFLSVTTFTTSELWIMAEERR